MLVGREPQLAELRKAARQPPAVVLIEGEAGVGKTRLIKEWLAEPELRGTAVLTGQCSPLREPLPFGPVIEALADAGRYLPESTPLSPVTGALRPLLPELADRLPPPLAPLGDRRQERHRVFRGLRDLLAGLGPAVLVLDDLHWLDSGTRELLRFLADRLPEHLRLVLSYRREDLADPDAPTIVLPAACSPLRLALTPLTVDQVAELVAAVDYPAPTGGFAEYLHAQTMGLPLAVEESLGLLRDRQRRATDPALVPLPDALTVPTALRDALLERSSRLSRSARRLLYAAAILTNPATEGTLCRVAGVTARHCPAALAELIGRGLLGPGPGDRYGFRHGLARQAVHDSLSEPTRRALHRRAVAALMNLDPRPLGQLAHHCRHAGLHTEWQHYAEAAADQAIDLGDDETAAQLLQEVVARADLDLDARVRIALKLGQAALTGLNHSEAITILRHTLAEADLPTAARGELRLYLGVLLRNQVRQTEAGRAELEQAVDELSHRPELAARAMASLGAPYLTDRQQLPDHLRWLARAGETAAHASDSDVTAVVVANRAAALISTGDPAGWRLLDAEAQPLLYVNGAWAAVCVGRYADAHMLLDAAGRLVTDSPGSYLGCALTGTALMHDLATGQWEGLSARARQVAAENADVPAVAAEARLVLGSLAMATGDLRAARDHLGQCAGSIPVAVAGHGGLARLATVEGDWRRGYHQISRGLALVRDKGAWCWAAELLPIAVTVVARAGNGHRAAEKLLAEVAEGLAGRETPLADVALLAGRALAAEAAGELATAAQQHAEAARGYDALPRPYAAALAYEAQGRCLVALGADGDAPLAEAVRRFESLRASWDLGRCRQLLRSLGGRLPHRRGRRGYGGQLSPREEEVVRLVRSGLTNREVAEALFLSPRTVEAHVARVLRKLGLPSRRTLTESGPDADG
ncbi:AAA family ATPase [Natronosporangium hydrolyticum]|uniref:AAA family ATPase n=1 Tax=Natronosporangium hydrolyticum TaxID=2811111 RepID=A0A895YIV0_9ACTN|nr:AAA family ATPase [Natronosporangium hydrolyticum]QSB15962.1 AAA family ATPase [Natronosporangium hydrolyticum]